jgi:hypothetical protein
MSKLLLLGAIALQIGLTPVDVAYNMGRAAVATVKMNASMIKAAIDLENMLSSHKSATENK